MPKRNAQNCSHAAFMSMKKEKYEILNWEELKEKG